MPSKRDEDAGWLLMKDERDARLESNRAFIMPQSTASASSGRAYVCKRQSLERLFLRSGE